MNELFKDKLGLAANDDLLLAAIKAVFDETIDEARPQIDESNNNAALGEKFRAYEISKNIIEHSFVELRSYKLGKTKTKTFNKEL